jgi:hypothetical protein
MGLAKQIAELLKSNPDMLKKLGLGASDGPAAKDSKDTQDAVSTAKETPAAAPSATKGESGRPVNTIAANPLKGMNQVLKPQFKALRSEILNNSPVLALDETTQNILKSQGKLIQDQLAGVIPQSVQAQVSQISAEKALKGGIVGQSAKNLQARDLGLTSLDIQKQGQASADVYVTKEREWSALRTDAMMNLRKLDLTAGQMKLEKYKIDETIRSQRLQLLSQSVSDYYTRVYSFASLKDSQQETVTNMTQAYRSDLIPALRKAAKV